MNALDNRPDVGVWDRVTIAPGEARDIHLALIESSHGITLKIPIHVKRGLEPGPVVFVTAALHGDELNGAGAVRHLIREDAFELVRGAVILVPVLNLLAFDRHSRYLPDRRDLNRCFPGSAQGSMASRVARKIFDEIVGRSDFGIDLHTASVRRTNYPTVRGDLGDEGVRSLAESFGCSIIVNRRGPKQSFRTEATRHGCPTIVMEGGEVWKVEPTIVEMTVRGIKRVLVSHGMLKETQTSLFELASTDAPPNPTRLRPVVIERTRWIRAEYGGFLEFHVGPGEAVTAGQPLATNTTLLGYDRRVLSAPFDAIVLGMTTLPAISPGDPVCHLGMLPSDRPPAQWNEDRRYANELEQRVLTELASNLLVKPPSPTPEV